MGDLCITVLIVGNGSQEAAERTIENLQSQDGDFPGRITLCLVEPKPGNLPWKAVEKALGETRTPYVLVTKAGTTFLSDALERCCTFFEEVGEKTDAVMMRCSFEGRKEFPQKAGDTVSLTSGVVFNLEDKRDIVKIPVSYDGVVLRTSAAKAERFKEGHGGETWEEYLYGILDCKKTLGYVRNAVLIADYPAKRSAERNKENLKKEWYLDTVRNHLRLLEEEYLKKYGRLPVYIQFRILYELKIRFECNKNRDDKHALNKEELEEFLRLAGELLEHIDDELLLAVDAPSRTVDISYALQQELLGLKYQESLSQDYFIRDGIRMTVNGQEISGTVRPMIYLDLVNYEAGKLVLDFSCADFLGQSSVKLQVFLGGKEYEYADTLRYAHTDYFSRKGYRDFTFRVTIPRAAIGEKTSLKFEGCCRGKKCVLPVSARRYTSRISPEVWGSYWCFGTYMITFGGNRKNREIVLEKAGPIRHIRQESRVLASLYKKKETRKFFYQRLDYWKSYPLYHRKNIWLTFDKIYKGGDCGEYFYKYMTKEKRSGVVPAYLINEDAPDRKRLEAEGYRPLIYGTREHRRMFLHAKMIFATHAGIYNFNHISQEELPYLQDLMNAEAICIQHGLTVQDLSFNSHRAFNNNKRYYCASKYEVENLLQPIYGYDDPSVIRLTGIPRFDGLVNEDKKQILIAPSWRNYIALPPVERNSTRPYSEQFKETEYFLTFNGLISDERLIKAAKETGYRIVFLVHPNISAQTKDFVPGEGVEVLSALDVDYEKILKESSLMVTDYSGIQFDFAYMRKPVVYYHPPKLPPHYVEGGFFYDTQGFGEICKEQEDLVDTLAGYMGDQCRVKPVYKDREDDFFAFDDHENCRRIFEDAFAFQKERKRQRK